MSQKNKRDATNNEHVRSYCCYLLNFLNYVSASCDSNLLPTNSKQTCQKDIGRGNVQ